MTNCSVNDPDSCGTGNTYSPTVLTPIEPGTGTGPYTGPGGSIPPVINPGPTIDEILDGLAESIEFTHLAQALRTRIAKIQVLEDGFTNLKTSVSSDVEAQVRELVALKNAVNQATAAYQNVINLVATENEALTNVIETYMAELGGRTALLEESTTVSADLFGKLLAEKIIKVDLQGNVAGYGISSTLDPDGTFNSDFRVTTNTFSIAPPTYVSPTPPNPSWLHDGYVWQDTSSGEPGVTKWWNKTTNAWQTTVVKAAQPFVYLSTPHTLSNGTVLPPGLYVNNALISELKADQIDTRNLTIRDDQGNVIFGAGKNLDWSRITGTDKPQNGATRNVFRGQWASGIAYTIGDVVLDASGYGWVCTTAHGSQNNNKPPTYPTSSNTYWSVYIVKGSDGKSITLSSDSLVFKIDKSGAVSNPTINIVAVGYGVVGNPTYTITSGSGTLNGAGYYRTLSYNNMYSDSLTIKISWDGLEDTITINKIREGADGVTVVLTNESHTVTANAAGEVNQYELGPSSGAVTDVLAWKGSTTLGAVWGSPSTGQFSVSISGMSGCTASMSAASRVQIDSVSADSGYVNLSINIEGKSSVTKQFSITKSKQGSSGAPGAAGPAGPAGARGPAGVGLNTSEILTIGTSGTVYVPGIRVGSINWNEWGTVTAGSGIAMTPAGIVGARNGSVNFTIDTAGNAFFAGQLGYGIVGTGNISPGSISSVYTAGPSNFDASVNIYIPDSDTVVLIFGGYGVTGGGKDGQYPAYGYLYTAGYGTSPSSYGSGSGFAGGSGFPPGYYTVGAASNGYGVSITVLICKR